MDNHEKPTMPADVEAFVANIENGVSKGDGGADTDDTRQMIAIIRAQGATIEKLSSYEGERMQNDGFYTAEIARVAAENTQLRDRLAKLELANAELESNLDTWKRQYASCQSQLHLANDELKIQMHMAGVDIEGISDAMQRVHETSRAIYKCHAFGMLRDAFGMPRAISAADAIDELADRLAKLEAKGVGDGTT